VDKCCGKAAKDAANMARNNMIQAIWQKHLDSGIGGKGPWTNQCGLLRCHCEELIEWLKEEFNYE